MRAVMITGDHPLTAAAIARDLGLVGDGDARRSPAPSSRALDDDELVATARRTSVYARVSPEDKLRIVEALQRDGHVVAMTGDGVNDAPALKQADIGVAMGITGTDVTKDAGDMVLQDDNFATIVGAVREGRVVFDNIRKFIRNILSGNVAEVAVMVLGPLAGMPIPLLPLQILWLNLVTDGLPAMALAVEPPEPGVMQRPPTPLGESLLGSDRGRRILMRGRRAHPPGGRPRLPAVGRRRRRLADRAVHLDRVRRARRQLRDALRARVAATPRPLHQPRARRRRRADYRAPGRARRSCRSRATCSGSSRSVRGTGCWSSRSRSPISPSSRSTRRSTGSRQRRQPESDWTPARLHRVALGVT